MKDRASGRIADISTTEMSESIQRAAARGISTPPYVEFETLFRQHRVALSLTIEELSQMSSVCREDIIDLELANIYLPQAIEIGEKLKEVLKIDDKTFQKTILQSTIKK